MNTTCPSYIKGTDKPCVHYITSEVENEAGFCGLPDQFRCTEALKTFSPTLTQSAYKAFAQCPMKYYYPYILGIKLKDKHMSDAIKGGTIWDRWLNMGRIKIIKYAILEDTNLILIAKLSALMKAYEELGIDIDIDEDSFSQVRVSIDVGGYNVTGTVDKAFDDHIEEVKLSGRPDWYTQLENIEFQCGTYLMSNPKWEYVDLKITRMPGLKQKKTEDIAEYQDRIFSDIVKRPAHYFIGYNIKNRTYGKRFWRSEFDFDELQSCYLHMVRNMRFMIDNQTWTHNPLACNVPTACFYLPIKKSGGCNLKPSVSQLLYEVMDVMDAREGML